ncbi:hypothetical protein [Embleya sp. NPDC005575]|uniref:hypothetical protein n=1 Tax=Embleya sp. NPDC005575 TaxID=3156892 RepID=UPI0033AF152A
MITTIRHRNVTGGYPTMYDFRPIEYQAFLAAPVEGAARSGGPCGNRSTLKVGGFA